jgi:hypothetical protein
MWNSGFKAGRCRWDQADGMKSDVYVGISRLDLYMVSMAKRIWFDGHFKIVPLVARGMHCFKFKGTSPCQV